jgi:fluoroacetyl-CoA thioesterase
LKKEPPLAEPLEKLRVGMTVRHEVVVTRELTVGGHVEGMPEVYGTPFMMLAMEVASGHAVKAHLTTGWVTVGTAVNIRHIAPTPIGRTVVATARVTEIGARSITFAVEAHDGDRLIGDGTHRRAAVDLETFGKTDAGR